MHMQDAAPLPMGERERERESCREAAGSFDLPLLASEASYGGLQDGTRAVVHCCLCGAGTQWNASSMVSHPSSRPPRRLRVRAWCIEALNSLPRALRSLPPCGGGRDGAWRACVRVLACVCLTRGRVFPAADGGQCNNCLKTRVDITEGIPREGVIQRCRGCGRYLDPPQRWVACELETKELMAVCLKRVKGLAGVKLIDASFIWTEPHSRRIKVKLTVQKEAYADVILQQVFAVDLKVENHHCANCHKVAASGKDQVAWEAVVQLRQRVDHKRTFYMLEQLILKHGAHAHVANIKEVPDGMDLFFNQERHRKRLVDFITSMVPCRVKGGGGRMISQDLKNNSAQVKSALCLEMVPLCKDDLFVLHPRQHSALGCMGPLVLVLNVASALRVVDLDKGVAGDLRADAFFRFPRAAIASLRNAISYTVLDVEKTGKLVDAHALAEVTVARSSDLGANDEQFVTMSHLGHILHAGDEVLGYDLTRLQSAQPDADADLQKEWPKGLRLPDVVLVKKVPPPRRSRRRVWKLRSLIKEEEAGRYVSMHKGGAGGEAHADDYEEFLHDIEWDAQARSNVDLYKDPAMWRIAQVSRCRPLLLPRQASFASLS